MIHQICRRVVESGVIYTMTFFFCLVAIMYENILQAETPNRELPRAYSKNLNNNTQKNVNRGFIR